MALAGSVRSARAALGVLTGLNVLNYADRYVGAAMMPLILSSLSLSDAEGGLLQSAFILSYALVSPLAGWLGDRAISIELRADGSGRWRLNDADCPAVAGCLDLDLSFTPATNLLPIRRLALPSGEKATVRAAWLTVPALTLEPLDQQYRRTQSTTYAYESDGGRFSTELEVNGDGFVTFYPDLWQAEAATAS